MNLPQPLRFHPNSIEQMGAQKTYHSRQEGPRNLFLLLADNVVSISSVLRLLHPLRNLPVIPVKRLSPTYRTYPCMAPEHEPLTPRHLPLRRFFIFSRRLVTATLVVSLFFILTQELQIFPGLLHSLTIHEHQTPPSGVEVLTTTSPDGTKVVVWRVKGGGDTKRVALLFHGNADRVASFVRVQRWLASAGITSYSVEYRGYSGLASGWPSESGLYEDAEAAMDLARREEGIEPREMIVLGSSIGTGIASHLAATSHPRALILLSPYTSLTEIVREMPLFGYLSPFLWYRFPSLENIAKLRDTCVIAAHESGHRHPFSSLASPQSRLSRLRAVSARRVGDRRS